MKQKLSKISLGLIIFLLLFLGIAGNYYYKTTYSQKRFEHFLDECFQYIATENALTLHMYLQDPEKYGIDQNKISLLPNLSEKARKERYENYESILEQLHHFSMKNLASDQQFLALLLEYNLKEYLLMKKEFPYYETNLGENGSLVDLSILFSEFTFTSQKDLTLYEKLLRKIPDYLDGMVDYEIRRQKSGIDPTPNLIDGTLKHIDRLLDSEESNVYLDSFENRINQLSFLSKSEKKSYLEKNKSLVEKILIPAYKKTGKSIKNKLLPSENNLNLASYPNGKSYYSHLLSSEVGTSLTPKQCYDILTKEIALAQEEIQAVYTENPEIELDYITAFPEIEKATDMLEDLKNVTRIEFPAIQEVDCEISEIYNSLDSISATAYYITPPLDYQGKNHIYLRGYYSLDPKLYTTMAHEGYPGHLYQTNYFYQNLLHPIQLYLKVAGYNEGWGTYAQYYSYDFLTFKDMDEKTTEQVKNLMRTNSILNEDLSCIADLMVNYFGYDKEKLADYMESQKIERTYSDQIYDYVCENPCAYLTYGIGYYEFTELLKEEKLKSGFSMLEFHNKVLSYGSCPFDLLRTMLNQGENPLSFVDNNE